MCITPSRLRRLVLTCVGACALLATTPGHANSGAVPQREQEDDLRVVVTVPVLGDLAARIGGQHVRVDVLASPGEDPHYIEPTPVLMQRAHRADVLIEVGLQLEPWSEKVATGSGNTHIQRGQPGRVIASKGVATLELPEDLSREWGDVHPYGNPHVWLDPLNVRLMAHNIAEAFSKLDSARSGDFKENLAQLEKEIDEALFGPELVRRVGGKQLARLARGDRLQAYLERRDLTQMLGGWLARAAPLHGRPIVSHHKTFVYFARRFGFHVPVEIEEKPGIPPAARHRERVLALIRERGVRTILLISYEDKRAAEYLAHRSGAQMIEAEIDLGMPGGPGHYFELIDALLDALLVSETRPAPKEE